jgi:homoserine O-acetyltransferase
MPPSHAQRTTAACLQMVDDYPLGPFTLQSGLETTALRLRYETHGRLNADHSNAILFPTWFAGRHSANQWIIGPGRALDTDRFFIIVVNAFGNGESSSPSNEGQLLQDGVPVAVSVLDNVHAQHRLVRSLGIRKLHAVVGRSMGAQQALQWACAFPGELGRVFAFCGLPRTTPHNKLQLEAMSDVLSGDGDATAAVQRAGRLYGAWAFSNEFLATPGDVEHWVEGQIVRSFQAFDPRDLFMLVRTWQAADISANSLFHGDLLAALRAIRVPTLLMPISHDLLFPPGEFHHLASANSNVQIRPLDSIWGHRAGAPGGSPQDIGALELALRDFLADRRLLRLGLPRTGEGASRLSPRPD